MKKLKAMIIAALAVVLSSPLYFPEANPSNNGLDVSQYFSVIDSL